MTTASERGSAPTAAASGSWASAAARSSTWPRSSTPTPPTTSPPRGYNEADAASPDSPTSPLEPQALGAARLPLGRARCSADNGREASPTALNEQIANEFAASQQYVGAAVYYDAETLPRLAAFFYRQAEEERNHAMMMVQYLLDAGEEVRIPDITVAADQLRRRRRAGADGARAGEAGRRGDLRAVRARPRDRRLPRRAVHAVVRQGAGRGGRADAGPAQRRRAREARTCCWPRTTSPASVPARTTIPPPRRPPAASNAGQASSSDPAAGAERRAQLGDLARAIYRGTGSHPLCHQRPLGDRAVANRDPVGARALAGASAPPILSPSHSSPA